MTAKPSSSLTPVSNSIGGPNLTIYSAKGQICNENIVTTRDRASLVFHNYTKNQKWTTEWLSYFQLFIGLLIPLITTSEFKGLEISGKIIVSGSICKSIVILMCIGAGLLFIYCLYNLYRNNDKLKCTYFIEQLKKDKVDLD